MALGLSQGNMFVMCVVLGTVKLGLEGPPGLGKVFAAGPYKRLVVRDAASSKLCGPSLLACAGARAGVRAPPKNPKESSDFAALLKRIIAKNVFECIRQINFSL